jgi:hypothetical protein
MEIMKMKIKRNFSHSGNRKFKEAMYQKTVHRKQNQKGNQNRKAS